MAGDWSGDCAGHGLGLCWLPVPAGGDLGRGPLVPALWAVLPRCRGVAGRARCHRDHVTIYRWVQRFTPEFIEAARPCRHVPGDRWFVDETYVKVAGKWTYLYRAVDQHGQVIDVLLSTGRDLTAAWRFFGRALRAGTVPVEVTTDRAPVCPRVLDELVPSALHTVGQYANNPIEADHGRLKARLRPMRGLKRHRSRGSSPPDTPSCRISAAATTTSPPRSPTATGSAWPSTTSHSPSEPAQHPDHAPAWGGDAQRNSASNGCGIQLELHNAGRPHLVAYLLFPFRYSAASTGG